MFGVVISDGLRLNTEAYTKRVTDYLSIYLSIYLSTWLSVSHYLYYLVYIYQLWTF